MIIKLQQSMNSFIYCIFFRGPTNKVEKVQRKQNRNSGIEITIYSQFWTLFSSFHNALEEFSYNSKHYTPLVREKCLCLWSTRLKLIVEECQQGTISHIWKCWRLKASNQEDISYWMSLRSTVSCWGIASKPQDLNTWVLHGQD